MNSLLRAALLCLRPEAVLSRRLTDRILVSDDA